MKLTEPQIRKARATDKPLELADGHRLILFVSLAGTKSWRCRYEVDGREKPLTPGTYPAMGLVKAMSRLVVRRDAAATFEAVARGWHALNATAWVEQHAADVLHRSIATSSP